MQTNARTLPTRSERTPATHAILWLALLLGLTPAISPALTNEIAPRLTALGIDDDGSVDLEATVPERSVVHLEATTDFRTWSCIATQTLWQNIEYFRVPPAPQLPNRFFRLLVVSATSETNQPDPTLGTEGQATNGPVVAKVLYGADDRRDVYQETDALRLRLAAATCGLVYADELHDLGDGTQQILTAAYTLNGLPPCEGERFATQPTAPYCTGFLVGEDLVATAGHCFDQDDIGEVRFVFGFKMVDPQTPVRAFAANQIYTGVQILGRAQDYTGADYAIIRLDRPVQLAGVSPLALRRSGAPAVGTRLGVIGHPHGLPLKLAFGDMTQVVAVQDTYFVSNLDTYGGNSGSPVFNATDGTVEGILLGGERDYLGTNGCFRSNQPLDSQGNEGATMAAVFASLVPVIIAPVIPPTTNGPVVWVNFAYAGTEAGTQAQPFRTLGHAATQAPAGAIIRIMAGNSQETLTLSRPARLEAVGGMVRISG